MKVRDIIETIECIDKIVDAWECRGLVELTHDDIENLIFIAKDHKDELLNKKVVYKEKER